MGDEPVAHEAAHPSLQSAKTCPFVRFPAGTAYLFPLNFLHGPGYRGEMLYIGAMRFHRGVRMYTASPVFPATLMFLASASFDAFAITVDLTSAVNGSLSGDQGFNGTQAVEVGVVCPLALSLTGMTLREFSVTEDDGRGSLAARIYDSQSGILIASAEATVATGFHQSITVPIFAKLLPGHTYRVGFYAGGGQFDLMAGKDTGRRRRLSRCGNWRRASRDRAATCPPFRLRR